MIAAILNSILHILYIFCQLKLGSLYNYIIVLLIYSAIAYVSLLFFEETEGIKIQKWLYFFYVSLNVRPVGR